MNFLEVFYELAKFFTEYCSVVCNFGDIHFTVGSMFLWSGLAGLAIYFLKRLA